MDQQQNHKRWQRDRNQRQCGALPSIDQITQADHPESSGAWADLPYGQRLRKLALSGPAPRKEILVHDRQISGAAGGKERRFKHNPEQFGLINHDDPSRAASCQSANPDNPPAHQSMTGTGTRVNAAAARLPATRARAMSIPERPYRRADLGDGSSRL